ncbi:Bicoid-interacting protein 3-domain-containing protein [Dichotomocladium elegans]|nr:Bicoid-interacting protein 3-domain-containing protein [Dichotomocladium elegans]
MSSQPEDNPYLRNPEEESIKRRRHRQVDGPEERPKKSAKYLGNKASTKILKKQLPFKKENTNFCYGNYMNYYNSRRTRHRTTDPRLDQLDASALFHGKTVLDIGCNSGNVTIIIAMQYAPEHIHGVDIDASLINKANQQIKIAYSLQDPTHEHKEPPDIALRFHYFPQALRSMYGFIPSALPPGTDPPTAGFPYNITFEAADWMDTTLQENQYDTVLGLSIAKWIHIHRGDDGMKDFFMRVYKVLKPGGIFVLEHQKFETYERRAKTSEEMHHTFEAITFRPDQFHDYLLNQVGFSSFEVISEPGEHAKGFDRPLTLYKK